MLLNAGETPGNRMGIDRDYHPFRHSQIDGVNRRSSSHSRGQPQIDDSSHV